MYNEYRGKKEIILWFYANNKPDEGSKKGKKRTHSPGEAEHTKRANYRTTAQTEKMEKVEKILKKLKEKHTGDYTEEKLRAWAHLIQMEKHTLLIPSHLICHISRDANVQTHRYLIPLHKHQQAYLHASDFNMRTACIEQLDKWYSLLEKGGITQQQYDQLQEKIMSDMLSM